MDEICIQTDFLIKITYYNAHLYLFMKRIILLAWLSVVALSMKGNAKEVGDWRSIHLIQGFDYFRFDALPLLTEEEQTLFTALQTIAYPSKHQVLLKENGEYFAFNTCDLNYWKWKDGAWKKMRDQVVSGYNCTPYFFIRDTNPYVLSGSGYWQNQTDLFLLNSDKDNVEFIPTIDQPEDYRGNLIFRKENEIYSLFGHKFNARLDVYTLELGGYYLNLSDSTWGKLKLTLNTSLEKDFQFFDFNQVNDFLSQVETDNYGAMELHSVIAKKTYWVVVDKRNLTVFLKETPFLQLTDSKWSQVIGNTIVHLGSNSREATFTSLDEVVKSATLIGKLEVVDPMAEENLLEVFYPVLVLIPLSLLILGGWWIGFRKGKTPQDPTFGPEDDELHLNEQLLDWLRNLDKFEGQLINQDQLDGIFGYKGIKNADLRKVKRARAIKALNTYLMSKRKGPAIIRVRDTQDKRVILYRIGQLSALSSMNKQSSPA